MLHRHRAATRVLGLLLGAVLAGTGCTGSPANATQRQAATGGTAADGASTDRGSRMIGFGNPVGSITVETPPVQGSSADAPLPPPLPPGQVAPPEPAPRPTVPEHPTPREPPPAGRPEESSGLGPPPIPAPEIRRHLSR